MKIELEISSVRQLDTLLMYIESVVTLKLDPAPRGPAIAFHAEQIALKFPHEDSHDVLRLVPIYRQLLAHWPRNAEERGVREAPYQHRFACKMTARREVVL